MRDDHEAALARADALQVELERERANDAEQRARIARLESELADARGSADASPPAAEQPAIVDAHRPASVAGPLSLAALGLLVVAGSVAWCARPSRTQSTTTESAAPPAEPEPQPPQPPFIASRLLTQGLSAIDSGRRVESFEVSYVDGEDNLDVRRGTIHIATTVPRSEGTDAAYRGDPQKLVGLAMANCPTALWTTSRGWEVERAPCIPFGVSFRGKEPGPLPKCTFEQVHARVYGAGLPRHLLITVRARPELEAGRSTGALFEFHWQWFVRVHDAPKDVVYEHTFSDEECANPAAAKAEPPASDDEHPRPRPKPRKNAGALRR